MNSQVRWLALLAGAAASARAFGADAGPADAERAIELCRTLADTESRLVCYDKIALSRKSSSYGNGQGAAPAARLEAAGVSEANAARVGLPVKPLPQKIVPGDRAEIESSIPGIFEGWQPQTRIRLLNGQLWQISDSSEGAYSLRDAKVKIERGSFGGFFMTIEGVGQTPRVRRLE
jgi:hypothetical protein